MNRLNSSLLVILLSLVVVIPAATQDNLPDSRPFHMGFTPWPYDFTDPAIQQTYDHIAQYGDMILHHMDTGIPWQEALDGTPYHPNVIQNIQDRIAERRPDQKVYLSITPNSLDDRNRIADYWAEEEHMQLPPDWSNRTFDDPLVVEAFLNHARFMIDQFDPDYFAYGIEVTCANRGPNDRAFVQLEQFASQVYPALKSEHPDLPIFLTICAISLEIDDPSELESANRQIITHSDYIGLSIYPYLFMPNVFLRGDANPSELPSDLFARYAALDPNKPFAITETGYIAEDLQINSFGIQVSGREDWQAIYTRQLLQAMYDLNAEFVIWYFVQDYDDGIETLNAFDFPTDGMRIWQDTGLLNGAGQPRDSLDVWMTWRRLPHMP